MLLRPIQLSLNVKHQERPHLGPKRGPGCSAKDFDNVAKDNAH